MTLEEANRLFNYDPATGVLTWKENRRGGRGGSYAGMEAGYTNQKGYRAVKANYKLVLVHRLAWLIHYGQPPEDQIDHINGNRSDNRIENLRQATHGQNKANSRCGSKFGLKGVYRSPNCKGYFSQISSNKKRYYLGTFKTPEDAHAAYVDAAKRLHGEFARAA